MKDVLWKDGASYGPEAVRVMGEAFDRAWVIIAGNFGHDERDIQKARTKLAEAVLTVAREQMQDAESLKNRALQLMPLHYRTAVATPLVFLMIQRPPRSTQRH